MQPTLTPWWLEEAPPDPEEAPLEENVEADVAIVGGGLTGLWTALALLQRDAGLRIVVLEAQRCGDGPSGRNGGFCHGYWPSLGRLSAAVGTDGALVTAGLSTGVYEAIADLGEDVWLDKAGMITAATTPAQEASVASLVRTAREHGVPEQAVALDREELALRCRSPLFRSGVFFPDCATVQPARLVRALRRAALAAGVALCERSRARSIRTGTIECETGSVRAREIVVATNAWMTGWRPARGKLTNFGSYVVLTEPVPQLLEEIGWTGGVALTDGRMFLHYFRTTPDGRVLMGSASGPIGRGGRIDDRFYLDRATAERAESGLRRLLPALAGARVEAAWGGPIDVSSDHLPFFATVPGTRIHYGAGYSGNGVGPSWLGGQVLASLALGLDDEWGRLPLVRRRVPRIPPEPLKRLGGGLIRSAILAVESADESGRRAAAPARAVAALPRLLGLRLGTR